MFKKWGAALLVLSLVSCSGSHSIHIDAMRQLLKEPAPLTLSKVLQSDVDLLYVTHDGRPFANVALAYIEKYQRKWMSSSGVLLVEENGRWVKTYGLGTHLTFSFSNDQDPLLDPISIMNGMFWSRNVDLDSGHYGHVLESTFQAPSNSFLALFGSSFDVFIIAEDVQHYRNDTHSKPINRWTNL
jgi:hypothetical protein